MGHTYSVCQTQIDPRRQLIDSQINIYKWRAQSNSFVSKVFFKRSIQYQHQIRLKEFLKQYQEKEYLQIRKLDEFFSKSSLDSQEIITFQKYSHNLSQIRSILTTSESIYVLLSLLKAFEQIKLKMKRLHISKKCCFVTKEGEIRGWINSNFKCNFNESQDQNLFEQHQYKEIVRQIISITKDLSFRDHACISFFDQLSHHLTNIFMRKDIFQYLRHWIKQYCASHQIYIAQRIQNLTNRNNQLKIKRTSKSFSIKNSRFLEEDPIEKENYSTQHSFRVVPDRVSRIFEPQRQIDQSKSFTERFQHITRRSNVSHQSKDSKVKSVSSINETRLTFNPSLINSHVIKPTPRLEQYQRKALKEKKNNVQFKNQNHFEVEPIKNKQLSTSILPIQAKQEKSNFQKSISLNNKSQDFQIILTQRDDCSTILIEKLSQKKDYRFKKSNKDIMKKRPSILEQSSSQLRNPKSQENNIHYNTFCQMASKMSISQQGKWLTNKTIARLIESQQGIEDSLVHSEGTSSSNIQDNYQGVLSNLAKRSLSKRISVYEHSK